MACEAEGWREKMNMGHCIAILGPTCAWKSEIGLQLAESCGGEIVSCDSMQIYRGLAVGTAQPGKDALKRVPHHLIAELDIHEPYDANRFVQRAKKALDETLLSPPAPKAMVRIVSH